MNQYTGRQARPQASINSLKWLWVTCQVVVLNLFLLNVVLAGGNSAADENIDLKLSNGTVANTCAFTDTPSSAWYTKYVMALCSAGIVIGYAEGNNRVFKPAQNVAMAEFLKMVNYTNDYVGTSLNAECNSTKNTANWWMCHVNIGKAKGFIPYPSVIKGESYVTRGSAFVYAAKVFFKASPRTEMDAVNVLVGKGVVDKAADYRLGAYITRAEVAKVVVHSAGAAGRVIAYWLIPATILSSYDIPKSSVTPTQTGNTLADRVVKRARLEIGKANPPWVDGTYTYCSRFVRMMFDKPAKYSSASQACQAFQSKGLLKTSGTPPLGSIICYKPTGYGHISIATGTGYEVGVTGLASDPNYRLRGVTELSVGSVISKGYWGYITADDFNRGY